ncbi:MAG: hypothetical protein ACFNTC_06295, partial [Prevotella sp.]
LSRSNDSILGNPRNGVKPMALWLSRFSSAISASTPNPSPRGEGSEMLGYYQTFNMSLPCL